MRRDRHGNRVTIVRISEQLARACGAVEAVYVLYVAGHRFGFYGTAAQAEARLDAWEREGR